MTRLLTEMMRGYLDVPDGLDPVGSGPLRSMHTVRRELPVSPSTSGWKVADRPRRLTRAFEFSDTRRMSDFLGELLAHESETGHHARITCEFPLVTVEVRTHDVDDVTELDRAYATMCDHVYEDVRHFTTAAGDEDVW